MPASAKLTIVTVLYHQLPDSSPVSMDLRFERRLDTLEQNYVRHTTVSEGIWQDLDVGWLKNGCSHLVIRQNDGRNWSKLPTPEQKKNVASRIVEISFDGINPHLEVRPGEAINFFPVDVSKVKLKCKNGIAKITIMAFPK